MNQTSIVLGILGGLVLVVALFVTSSIEPVTELWLLDHRAYLAPAPVFGGVYVTPIFVSGLPAERIVARYATNITTVERVRLPVGYESNTTITYLLRGYPVLERLNSTVYASRIASVELVPAVRVRGMVGLRNSEGRDISYPYTVTAYDSKSETVLASSSAVVKNGGAVGIPVNFDSVEPLRERTRVVIELTGRSEHVQFWLEPNRGYDVVVS